MWTAASRARRSNKRGKGVAPLAIAAWVALTLVPSTPTLVAEEDRRLDYLNESMRVPESSKFRESDYIDSGVGLRFGVDRRLSYYAGQYEEASVRFEESVQAFRYKSDIWVFLSRAYFFMKEPEKAREALQRAAAVMPDLNDKLWNPLLAGLLWEIRQRALALQTEIDFYSKEQGDFLGLFRLYRFLEDYKGAGGVILAAEGNANKMNELASMASAASRPKHVAQSKKWQTLADKLRAELVSLGHEVPPRVLQEGGVTATSSADAELTEQTRLLQLRIDFYQAQHDEYTRLFENYLALDRPMRAKGVVEALAREIIRVRLRVDSEPDFLEQANLEDEILVLREMQKTMRSQLPESLDEGE